MYVRRPTGAVVCVGIGINTCNDNAQIMLRYASGVVLVLKGGRLRSCFWGGKLRSHC